MDGGEISPDGDELLALLAALDGDMEAEMGSASADDAPVVVASAYSDERVPLGDNALGILELPSGDDVSLIFERPAPTAAAARRASDSPDSYERALVVARPTVAQLSAVVQSDSKPATEIALVPGAEVARAKRSYDPNKARNERVKQIRGLREEIAELTTQLQALRGVATHGENSERLSEGDSSASQEEQSASEMGAPFLWEAICRNELEHRVRVEIENARLKRTLDDQVQVANGLQRLVQKAAKARKLIGGLDARSTQRIYALPSDSDEDVARFTQLLADVDASYHEIDEIYEMNGISSPGGEPRRGSNMRTGEHGRRFADIYSIDLLPFSVGSTAEVVWDFYRGLNKHRGPLYYKSAKTMEPSENTIVEKFAIELSSNNTRADFRVWQVLRRYVEADRVLVVWVGMLEPVELANKSFSRGSFREKGYVTCSCASPGSDADADAPAFTRLRRCHRIAPYITHAAAAPLSARDKRDIGAVIDFIRSLDNINVHLARFENELLRHHQPGRAAIAHQSCDSA